MLSTRALLLALATALCACSVAGADSAARVPRTGALEDVPAATLRDLDPARLSGTWYVVVSNFPFWTKKQRSDQIFLYDPIEHPAVVKYRDVSRFRQRGRPRRFVGVDIQDPERAGHFQWQGDGGLYGLTNQWYVVGLDPDYRWAIVYFSRSSWGTPGGLEILSRTPSIDDQSLARALAIIRGDPGLAARGDGLFMTHHGPGEPVNRPLPPRFRAAPGS